MTSTWTSTVKSRLLLLVASAVFVLALAGCGGGGDKDNDASGSPSPGASADVSAEEAAYYAAVAEVINDSNAAITAAGEARTEAFAAETAAERESLLQEFVDANRTALQERASAISALTPPETLELSHSLLVSAANDAIPLAEQIATAIEEQHPETEEDYAALAFELDAATVTSRFRDACGRLQLGAGGAAAEVDLGCSP
jgi:hypothetical protein